MHDTATAVGRRAYGRAVPRCAPGHGSRQVAAVPVEVPQDVRASGAGAGGGGAAYSILPRPHGGSSCESSIGGRSTWWVLMAAALPRASIYAGVRSPWPRRHLAPATPKRATVAIELRNASTTLESDRLGVTVASTRQWQRRRERWVTGVREVIPSRRLSTRRASPSLAQEKRIHLISGQP